ncbi:PrsW family intramembrane metalloprotease [Nocardia jiangxiensis]|uniref:PrsW family intramembrane metalloprotease n=1 Tax=Nocardia jiangxiensis TaxID=282685 RepID=UPI0002DC6AD5|nr:PrsW family intramembrane metalloprotease [Nocardia jiangxiensis]
MSWFRPRSALWWTYCLICLGGSIALVLQLLPAALLTWSGILVGVPFMVVTLLVVAALLAWLDLFRDHVRIRVALAMGFVWGALAGPGIAIFGNDNVIHAIANLAGDAFAVDWQAPISASIIEEGIKGTGVLAVAWLFRSQLSRPMHGLLLGGFTGLGFQLTEDATYQANAGLQSAQGDLGTALLVAILRLLTGVTSHWMLTGIAGIGIVTAVGASGWSRGRRAAALVVFYLLGAAMHFGWDAPMSGSTGFGSVVRRTMLYVVIFIAVYLWVVRIETRWFRSVVDWAVAQHLAPPDELNTLISRRSRRQARRALRLPHRIAVLRRHELLDWVQIVDARLTGTDGAILGGSAGPAIDHGTG